MYKVYLFFVLCIAAGIFFLCLLGGLGRLADGMPLRPFYPEFIAPMLASLAVWFFHWRYFNTPGIVTDESGRALLRMYTWLVVTVALTVAASSLNGILTNLLSKITQGGYGLGFGPRLATFAIASPIWLYHFSIIQKTNRASKPRKRTIKAEII